MLPNMTISPEVKSAAAAFVAEQILNGLEKQPFTDWYNSDFDNYLRGEEGAPTRETILKRIECLFKLN
jgi:hypothetical protein